MKRILSAAVALSALALSTQAHAVDYCVGSTNGTPNAVNPLCSAPGPADQQAANALTGGTFAVTGNIFNGIIDAVIGHSRIAGNGLGAGDATLTDRFFFTIPQTGLGGGSVSNVVGQLLNATDIDFVSVFLDNSFNIFNASISNNVPVFGGYQSIAGLNSVPIFTGAQNILTVTYRSGAQGSYGGQLNFVPVPEPTTWALMLAGFGAIGFAMRRRRKPQPKVRFAF